MAEEPVDLELAHLLRRAGNEACADEDVSVDEDDNVDEDGSADHDQDNDVRGGAPAAFIGRPPCHPHRNTRHFPIFIILACAVVICISLLYMTGDTNLKIARNPITEHPPPSPSPPVKETEERLNIDSHFDPPANQPPRPLCLVAVWEELPFPRYMETFLKSVERNAGFAYLYLFYHKRNDPIFGPPLEIPNGEAIDIANIDPSYATRGFPGFMADRLCNLYRQSGNATNAECNALETALKSPGSILQLRPAYGELFRDWINRDRCDAWAWCDVDSVFGDLGYWLGGAGGLLNISHIVSLGSGDIKRRYIHGQFTAHNQRRADVDINKMWRKCALLSSMQAALQTFVAGERVLDEGCYSYALLSTPGIEYREVPLQAASWGQWWFGFVDRGPELVALVGKAVLLCVQHDRGVCWDHLLRYLSSTFHRNDTALTGRGLPPWSILQKRTFADTLHVSDGVTTTNFEILSPTASSELHCSFWVPKKYNLCLQNQHPYPELAVRKNHLPVMFSNGSSSALMSLYTYPPLSPSLTTRSYQSGIPGWVEILQFHYQDWKGLVDTRCSFDVWKVPDGFKVDEGGDGEGKSGGHRANLPLTPLEIVPGKVLDGNRWCTYRYRG